MFTEIPGNLPGLFTLGSPADCLRNELLGRIRAFYVICLQSVRRGRRPRVPPRPRKEGSQAGRAYPEATRWRPTIVIGGTIPE